VNARRAAHPRPKRGGWTRLITGPTFVASIAAGFATPAIPGFAAYKVLNIIAALYGLLSVVVLSEYLIRRTWWQNLVANRISRVVIWIQFNVPVGLTVGAVLNLFHSDGSKTPAFSLIKTTLWVTVVSVVATFILEDTVVRPLFRALAVSAEERARVLGFYLLIMGLATQLAASVLDLLG